MRYVINICGKQIHAASAPQRLDGGVWLYLQDRACCNLQTETTYGKSAITFVPADHSNYIGFDVMSTDDCQIYDGETHGSSTTFNLRTPSSKTTRRFSGQITTDGGTINVRGGSVQIGDNNTQINSF